MWHDTLNNFTVACCAIVFTVVILYLWKKMTSSYNITPVHIYQETSELMKQILKKGKALTKSYKPQVWMSNRHLQSILPCIMEWTASEVQLKREYFVLDDGEEIAVDWVLSATKEMDLKDIVIILPGITGDPKGYPTLCRMCVKQNFRTAVISKRGYGGSKLKLPKLTGFGDGSDLHSVLKKIRTRYRFLICAITAVVY